MKQPKLSKQITQLINELDTDSLECLYFGGGRIWMDGGDRSLAITYAPAPGHSADAEMDDIPSIGVWVWLGIDFWTLEGKFPNSDGDDIGYGCPGLADWTREFLLNSAKDIAEDLDRAAEMSFDQQCLERMPRCALVQAVKSGRTMPH